MTIPEKNNIIAAFLKWKQSTDTLLYGEWYDEQGLLIQYGYTGGALKFHESWDWLMPVIFKLTELFHQLPSNDDSNPCKRAIATIHLYFLKCETSEKALLSIFEKTVEAIKLYNYYNENLK